MRDIKTLLEILLYEYQNNIVEWIQLHGLCYEGSVSRNFKISC